MTSRTSDSSAGLSIDLYPVASSSEITYAHPGVAPENLAKKDSILSERTLHPNVNVNITNFTSNRNAGELNTILGDDQSRIKTGAKLVQHLTSESDEYTILLALEKAKSKSRVDLDLFLENDTCVEGGVLRGRVSVRIREHKKKAPVLISGGKLRVIGFETIAEDAERFTFYQCSAALSDIASGLENLCSSKPDQEGFYHVREGTHYFPFELPLETTEGQTIPKGTTYIGTGVSVCYIVMISFRIKDPISGKKSVAHFYRNCVIWPRLDPSAVLAPTSRPLQLSDSIQTGKTGEICLTASLHRLHWVAGQLCHIQLKIANKSNKALETVSFELLKTITVFKIVNKPDGDEPHFQSSHQTKSVAQNVLSIAERGKRGHASAGGWWAGIAPGETQTLRYPITIPENELSIPRGKLLQVSYNIRTTVSGAKPRRKDVNVSLPIEIINFLSIDPPPVSFISAPSGVQQAPASEDKASDSDSEADSEPHRHLHGTNVSDYEHDEGDEDTGNLHIHDDTDEVVQHAVLHANIDADYAQSAPRFSDLYYSYSQEKQKRKEHGIGSLRGGGDEQTTSEDMEGGAKSKNNFLARVEAKKKEYKRQKMFGDRLPYTEDTVGGGPDPNGAEASDYGYLPHTSESGKAKCTCGAAEPLVASLPVPPKGLTRRVMAAGTSRSRRYTQPLSEGDDYDAHGGRHDDRQDVNAGLAVPCQTPGQINSPSIPRAGTVKDKIRNLEGV